MIRRGGSPDTGRNRHPRRRVERLAQEPRGRQQSIRRRCLSVLPPSAPMRREFSAWARASIPIRGPERGSIARRPQPRGRSRRRRTRPRARKLCMRRSGTRSAMTRRDSAQLQTSLCISRDLAEAIAATRHLPAARKAGRLSASLGRAEDMRRSVVEQFAHPRGDVLGCDAEFLKDGCARCGCAEAVDRDDRVGVALPALAYAGLD